MMGVIKGNKRKLISLANINMAMLDKDNHFFVWARRQIIKQILAHAKIIPKKASLPKKNAPGHSKGDKFIL